MSRVGHCLRAHDGVKLFSCQEAQLHTGVAQAAAICVCRVGDLGGLVIANLGGQGRHQHQRVADVGGDTVAVERHVVDQILHKAVTRIVEQRDRVQEVVNYHRLEHVQLKI